MDMTPSVTEPETFVVVIRWCVDSGLRMRILQIGHGDSTTAHIDLAPSTLVFVKLPFA